MISRQPQQTSSWFFFVISTALCTAPALGQTASPSEEIIPSPPAGTESQNSHPPRTESSEQIRQQAPVTEATPSRERSDEVWREYDRAVEALATQRPVEATALLKKICSSHPNHPAAIRARILLRRMSARTPLATQRTAPPSKTNAARAELIVAQTFHGLGLGLEVCGLAKCGRFEPWIISALLGTGAGLGLSLLLTRNGIEANHSLLLNEGVLWGAWNSLTIFGASHGFRTDHAWQTLSGVLIAGQLAGLGLGHLTWSTLHPSVGDVAFTSATGTWSGVLASFGLLAFAPDSITGPVIWGVLLAATNAGILGGALLTKIVRMSRSRVLVIDAGGLVGGLLGLGIAALSWGRDVPREALGISGMIGTVAGLGLTYFFTRNWDAPKPSVQVGLAPTSGGGVFSVSGRL